MSAPRRLPREGSSRAVRPLLALATAAVLALSIGMAISPIAAAHHPPSGTDDDHAASALEIRPTHGRSTSAFEVTFRVGDRHGRCKYATVAFTWDDLDIGTTNVDPATCKASLKVRSAPSITVGPHALSAVACKVDSGGANVCDTGTRTSVAYRVDATPTLVLVPAAGPSTTGFRATYSTNDPDCSYRAAAFRWDGVALGPRIDLDASCTATLELAKAPQPDDPGTHTMSVSACRRSCDPATTVETTYVVTAPPPPPSGPSPVPTAVPTAKPTANPPVKPPVKSPAPAADPTARPTARTIPRPTAEPSPDPGASGDPGASEAPSGAPSAEPSGSPEPSPSPATSMSPGGPSSSGGPGASPTGGVLEATSPPGPGSSPGPVAVVVVPSNPPNGNPYVPELAAWVGGPDTGPMDLAVVATNLFLTFLLIFLFGLTAEVFNSTMDSNRAEVHGWWARLLAGPFRFVGPLVVTGASLDRLAGSGRFGSLIRVLAVLSLLGLVYGFLSPDFGLNASSAILVVSLVIGLGFLTYWSESSASRLAVRRYRANASIKLYGTAIFVAILAVVVSRLVSFQPGLLYGFIASAVIVAPIAMAKRDDATLVLVPAFGLLVVSLLAWLLLGPVRMVAADGSPGPALIETILAMIVIGGLEGLFITMIPLRFLDGATVMRWSRVAWVVTFGTVTFLWWQLLINQNAAYVSALEQTNVQMVFAVLAVFILTTGGIWSYFRFRPVRVDAEG